MQYADRAGDSGTPTFTLLPRYLRLYKKFTLTLGTERSETLRLKLFGIATNPISWGLFRLVITTFIR